jgi:hypothetical protein
MPPSSMSICARAKRGRLTEREPPATSYLYNQILTFSGKKTKSLNGAEGELGDDHKLLKFESSADHLFAERSDVVLVRVADLFDEAMRSESFEQARHLAAAAFRQMAAPPMI